MDNRYSTALYLVTYLHTYTPEIDVPAAPRIDGGALPTPEIEAPAPEIDGGALPTPKIASPKSVATTALADAASFPPVSAIPAPPLSVSVIKRREIGSGGPVRLRALAPG